MARTIGIGRQDFEEIRVNHNFYVDKTDFIRQWWEASDDVTLIVRPRRFGKTLNMSMLEQFFPFNMPGREICLRGFPYGKKKLLMRRNPLWRNLLRRITNTGSFREPIL